MTIRLTADRMTILRLGFGQIVLTCILCMKFPISNTPIDDFASDFFDTAYYYTLDDTQQTKLYTHDLVTGLAAAHKHIYPEFGAKTNPLYCRDDFQLSTVKSLFGEDL